MNKENIKNKINNFIKSKKFKNAIYVLGALFVVCLIFQAGVITGFKKASFVCNWGGNYERNFGPNKKSLQFIKDSFRDIPDAHGAIGKIVKNEYPSIFVLDKDQTEKIIIVNDETVVLERKNKLSTSDLIVDKYIVVIGTPNDNGQIEAKIIRIIPSPEDMPMNRFDNNGFGGGFRK